MPGHNLLGSDEAEYRLEGKVNLTFLADFQISNGVAQFWSDN